MSAPMIAWEPIVKRLYRYLNNEPDSSSSLSIDLPSVEIHNIEEAIDKRPRTLKHLIKANHINYAIFYENLVFHNHMPHLLGSAYILGADVKQLHAIYDKESSVLAAWTASPAEITSLEWRNHLGDKRYQRAYLDFFEDELALKFDYNWKLLVQEYLFSGEEPLFNGIISGLGHSLIHMSYAFELSSRELAIEALAEACVSYDYLHKYLDDLSYTIPCPSFTSTYPLEILHKIHNDSRLNNLFPTRGPANLEVLFTQHENIFLEYWNSWTFDNPIKQFQDSQDAAIALVSRTVKPGTHDYDFFVVHILTTSHAVRILLPLIPKTFHLSLIRQWWLLTVAVYIAQLRPEISDEIIKVPTGKTWKYVIHEAINGKWALDAHYVKALRAIQVAASTWGDDREQYLAAAVRLADEFDGWKGFGEGEEL